MRAGVIGRLSICESPELKNHKHERFEFEMERFEMRHIAKKIEAIIKLEKGHSNE